jgi:hypothetical protein
LLDGGHISFFAPRATARVASVHPLFREYS